MNPYSRFGAAVSLLNRSAHVYFSRELKPWNIGPGQQGYLMVIEPDEELNQDEIARRHRVDKANVARAIGALETRGFLARRRDPRDRRNWLVSLTPAGREARAAVERIMQRWMERLREPFADAEWRALLDGLESVADRADRVVGEARETPSASTSVRETDGEGPTSEREQP